MGVNKVIYGNEIKIDITDSTVTPENLLKGEIAYAKDGSRIVGNMEKQLGIHSSNHFIGNANSVYDVTNYTYAKLTVTVTDNDPELYVYLDDVKVQTIKIKGVREFDLSTATSMKLEGLTGGVKRLDFVLEVS